MKTLIHLIYCFLAICLAVSLWPLLLVFALIGMIMGLTDKR